MTTTTVFQGMILLFPLIFFSVLAFWQLNLQLFMLTAAVALMTGLYIPDLLTGGTSTPLSLSLGLVVIMYSFICIGFAYLRLYQLARGQ